MAIPNATHQAAATAISALGNYISVHTAPAGTTGASEATGGSYVRLATTWTPGTTGIVTGSTVNIAVPAGTYVEGGIFNAATGGTFVGSGAFAGGNVIVSGVGASINITPTISA